MIGELFAYFWGRADGRRVGRRDIYASEEIRRPMVPSAERHHVYRRAQVSYFIVTVCVVLVILAGIFGDKA
jgi:hypothetical protein